ncbi:MAG: fibronectin type III domain-containing protein [Calditrichaeota bacterium]|nr:fibronectin type III domain-containing protein [Calditrichota bacterium]
MLFAGASIFAQQRNLDDTAAYINLTPGLVTGLSCEDFVVNIQMTATDARVFDLRFVFESSDFVVTDVIPGPHPDLHILPHLVESDTLSIDGFFHPNFTGTTLLASVHMSAINQGTDHNSFIGFLDGQGFSGTGEAPEAISMDGDTTLIALEGTVPLPPDSVIIIPMMDDSVRVEWKPVTLDIDGGPVVSPWYIVEFEDALNNEGIYIPIDTTQSTYIYHDFIVFDFDPGDTSTVNVGTYRVKALKCQP